MTLIEKKKFKNAVQRLHEAVSMLKTNGWNQVPQNKVCHCEKTLAPLFQVVQLKPSQLDFISN